MKTWTAILIVLLAMIFLALMLGDSPSDETSSNKTQISAMSYDREMMQNEHWERDFLQKRVSRAKSQAAAASASTTTSSTPTTLAPRTPKSSTSLKPTTTVPSTSSTTITTEPAPVSADNCGPGRKKWAHARACYFHLIQKYPWPHERAFEILYCESTGDPRAVSPSGKHWGLMQLDTGPFWDPEKNIEVAYNAYYKSRGNFSKWAC